MATIIGTAAIYGLDGTLAWSGVATTDNEAQSASLQDSCDKAELKDGTGATIGKRYYNRRHTLTVEVVPLSKAKATLPALGALVTLAGFGIGGASLYDGNWNYDGEGSIEPGQGEVPLKLKMTLVRYGDTAPAAFAVV